MGRIAAIALSLILFAFAWRQFNITGWETFAIIGGILLFIVLLILIGRTFRLTILAAALVSLVLTAIIMWFVYPVFALALILIFLGIFLLIVAIAYHEQQNSSYQF